MSHGRLASKSTGLRDPTPDFSVAGARTRNELQHSLALLSPLGAVPAEVLAHARPEVVRFANVFMPALEVERVHHRLVGV